VKKLRFILPIFVFQIGVTACATRPLRVPDTMPTAADTVAVSGVVPVVEKLDTEVVEQSWHSETPRWPQFNRGLIDWTATIKNDAPQSRDICVVFHLFNANHRALRGVRGCRVVAPGQEGRITSSAYIDLDRLNRAQTGHVDPYESHTIYYPRSATN